MLYSTSLDPEVEYSVNVASVGRLAIHLGSFRYRLFCSYVYKLGSRADGRNPASCGVNTAQRAGTRTGAIAGGVVGAIVALALLAFLLYKCLRRRRRIDPYYTNKSDEEHELAQPK